MAKFLNEALVQKFEAQQDCDVFFNVGGKTIGTHRFILNIQNQTLYEMTKEWSPDKEPVPIEDMDYDSFEALLRYFYNEEIKLPERNVFGLLFAAKRFEMPRLEKSCCDHISRSITTENVCSYMTEAINFESKVLQEKCLELFSKQTDVIMKEMSFLSLSQPALSAFLDAEETNILEVDVFRKIIHWMEQKCKEQKLPVNGVNMRHVIGDALYKIRFPSMTNQDFGNVVCTIKGLLTEKEEAQIFKKIIIFDNKDIECPFSNNVRCQVNRYYTPFNEMFQLLNTHVIHNTGTSSNCTIDSMLKHTKDLSNGEQIHLTSIRLILQCCADLANSSGTIKPATLQNHIIRQEIYEDFLAWNDTAKSKNIGNIMTEFIDMRSKLDSLCPWHF